MILPLAQLEETDDFASIPETQRMRVRKWKWAFANVPGHLPTVGDNNKFAWIAASVGVSEATAKLVYYKWNNKDNPHDWRVLCDGRSLERCRNRHDSGAGCERFKAWVLHKAESYQRSSDAAIREIERIFRTGSETIPGFEDWTPGPQMPKGCSRPSLRRILKGRKRDLVIARVGKKAAKGMLPSVYTTRRGLPVGRIYQFDDMWHDLLVIMRQETVRVMEFGAVDIASACRIHWGTLPRVIKEDGKQQGLTGKLFRAFVGYVCRYIGVHPEGCIFQMEHGTASLGKRHISMLEDDWGKVRVMMGGIQGQDQKKFGGYEGRRGGNPTSKPQIEGQGSLSHNDLSYLPAQVGKNRDFMPEATWGMQDYQSRLLEWEAALIERGREDLAEQLRHPVLKYSQFTEILAGIYAQINGRTDHNLEGWSDNTLIEYQQTPGNWIPYSQLDFTNDLQRQMFMMQAGQQGLLRERKLSPWEVWTGGSTGLLKMPLSIYVDFIGDEGDFGRTVKVRKGVLTVQDKDISPEPLIYKSQVRLGLEPYRELQEGAEYHVVINPYNVNALVVLDDRKRILGEAPLYTRIAKLDTEEIYRETGRTAARIEQMTGEQQARFASDNAGVEGMKQHNLAIAQAAGLVSKPARQKPAASKKQPSKKLPDGTASLEDIMNLF